MRIVPTRIGWNRMWASLKSIFAHSENFHAPSRRPGVIMPRRRPMISSATRMRMLEFLRTRSSIRRWLTWCSAATVTMGCDAHQPTMPNIVPMFAEQATCVGCTVVTPPAGAPAVPSEPYSATPYNLNTVSATRFDGILRIVNAAPYPNNFGVLYKDPTTGGWGGVGSCSPSAGALECTAVGYPGEVVCAFLESPVDPNAATIPVCYALPMFSGATTDDIVVVYFTGGISKRAPGARTNCTTASGLRFTCPRSGASFNFRNHTAGIGVRG